MPKRVKYDYEQADVYHLKSRLTKFMRQTACLGIEKDTYRNVLEVELSNGMLLKCGRVAGGLLTGSVFSFPYSVCNFRIKEGDNLDIEIVKIFESL